MSTTGVGFPTERGTDARSGTPQPLPAGEYMPFFPTVQLENGEKVGGRVHLNDGQTMSVQAVGTQTDQNTIPSGLKAVIQEESNGTVQATRLSRNTKRVEDDPLVTIDGPLDLFVGTLNDTGNTQNASSFFVFYVSG